MINRSLTRNRCAQASKTTAIAALAIGTALLGGCASSGMTEFAGLSEKPKTFAPLQANAAPIDKAVQYWSQAFADDPGNEKAAVAYARNLRAKGEKQKALQVLQRASIANSDSKAIASEYARVAVDLGQLDFAQKLMRRATDPNKPDWKLISAEGAALAKQGKHKQAQGFFLRALKLKPSHPPLLNNLALAYALNGDIDDAEMLLRKAAHRGQNLRKIRQNLALVLGMQGKYGESEQVQQAVMVTEGKAKSNTEFLKRWVKASPQTAPQLGWQTETQTTVTASLADVTKPVTLLPWQAQTKTADASWATETKDGH